MKPDSDTLRLLAIVTATKFVLSGSGRILRENDPDQSPGPRFFVAGCPMGNLAYVRHDVSDRTAARMLHLLGAEPPWSNPQALPISFLEVMDLLARETPVTSVEASLIYALPQVEAAGIGPRFICSGSDEGAELLARFQQAGLPQHLIDAGFVGICDFWAPWCVAIDGDAIAAFAFAARLGVRGAEVGVYTFPGWRSRGFAAAVTAKWSSLPGLLGRELFYSANVSNKSSQRVAGRLGLSQFAVGLRVA
jgi:hypothetical protein